MEDCVFREPLLISVSVETFPVSIICWPRQTQIEKRGEGEAEQRSGEPMHLLSTLLQSQRLWRHRVPMEEVVARFVELPVDEACEVGPDYFSRSSLRGLEP